MPLSPTSVGTSSSVLNTYSVPNYDTNFSGHSSSSNVGFPISIPVGLYDVVVAEDRYTKSHQIRTRFAEAGCPILFDPFYHPDYNLALRRNVFFPPGFDDSDLLEEEHLISASQTYDVERRLSTNILIL